MYVTQRERTWKNKSPSAWMQEAYFPLCGKCSVLTWPGGGGTYLGWGRGTYLGPPLPLTWAAGGRGVPTLDEGGGTYLGRGRVPTLGYPLPPSWPGQGEGVPTLGYLPWVWTDRHLWKQYLPVVLPTRAVNIRRVSRRFYTYKISRYCGSKHNEEWILFKCLLLSRRVKQSGYGGIFRSWVGLRLISLTEKLWNLSWEFSVRWFLKLVKHKTK